jgi:hypothetical protein
MDTTDFSGITLVIIKMTNTDAAQALTTGIYELPDGVSAEEAQATMARGEFVYRYLGPTPLHPGETFTFAFLVEPGKHYLVQEWTLDQNLQTPQILQGMAFAATFVVAEDKATRVA